MWRALRTQILGGKKLTFLYVPDNASVRQFMVPKVVFHALAGVAVLGIGLIAFFGSQYLTAAAEGRALVGLRGENLQLRDKLQDMQEQIATLQGEMKAGLELTQRLRTVASLEELDAEVLQAGAGGPAGLLTGTEAMAHDARADVEVASRDLGQLLRQAKMQRESYDEILAALQEKKQGWDRTPSVRPLSYCTITSRYGRRMDPFTGYTAWHRGVDFAAQPGSPIRATADGVIIAAGRSGGYGLLVEIDHGSGLMTRYAHCSSSVVRPGDRVRRGQTIARVGSSGRASGSHVHYEILRNGLHMDPMDFVLPTDVVID
jgi:murein DD-endopeptidase MepM/ murein hydrolase activator NlpD